MSTLAEVKLCNQIKTDLVFPSVSYLQSLHTNSSSHMTQKDLVPIHSYQFHIPHAPQFINSSSRLIFQPQPERREPVPMGRGRRYDSPLLEAHRFPRPQVYFHPVDDMLLWLLPWSRFSFSKSYRGVTAVTAVNQRTIESCQCKPFCR